MLSFGLWFLVLFFEVGLDLGRRVWLVGVGARCSNVSIYANGQSLAVANVALSKPMWLLNYIILYYTVCIKKKVIHNQRPIVLKSIDLKICVWHRSKEQLILFPFVHSCIRYVMHDRVHCHWRWQCHDPLFASLDNWIKASLPNSVMVWLLKLSHLMPGDHFLSGKL